MNRTLTTPAPAILVVDDCPACGALVNQAFRDVNSGYTLNFIDDGEKAIKYLRSASQDDAVVAPRVVLLDVNMPRLNGLEVLRELRADRFISPLSVIMMTTSRLQRDVDEAYRWGANAYVVKPLELPGWERLLKSVVEFWLEFAEIPDHAYHNRHADSKRSPVLEESSDS
ncbi:MAG: response regulator [Planctomycetaceae bacterium]|nr:response regulator [Planctomycetales bacterium]MCB9873501.1 response regulator [Planctomycetaceae bacterium]MCB9940411.1 response regulator [Planctomycetaceae bacterium]HRX82404.1 response regulator [Pirellulaceae bacterium]